ncbi:hypothetical protein GCM10027440_54040 [Nocardiopsis coralliicola]
MGRGGGFADTLSSLPRDCRDGVRPELLWVAEAGCRYYKQGRLRRQIFALSRLFGAPRNQSHC